MSESIIGVAPCGATYGTAAGPNDGVTRCGCGEIHPIQVACVRCRWGVLTPVWSNGVMWWDCSRCRTLMTLPLSVRAAGGTP